MLLLFLSTFMSFATFLILISSLIGRRSRGTSGMRLQRMTAVRGASPPIARWNFRLARQLTGWIGHRTGSQRVKDTQGRLASAGLGGATAAELYLAAQVAALPVGLLLAATLPHARLLGMIIVPLVLWVLPVLAVRQLIRRRSRQIGRSMADVVDLLVICIEAGLGLDQAVLRVAEELSVSHRATHTELLQVVSEQRVGKPRMQAWQDLAGRLALPEMDAFVAMLLQADRFGMPIARALTTYAQNLRLRRTQRAEEQAAKTTIKILFPLVLFLFPTIFIVLLGPAILMMMHSFAGGPQ